MIEIGILDGTPTDKIIDILDSSQTVKAKYVINSDAVHNYDLMGDQYIEIKFVLNTNALFRRTDYILWQGIKYTLRNDYQPTEINSVNFEYTLRFESPAMLLQDAQMYYTRQDLKEGEWSLTSDAASFVNIAAINANRYFNTNDWQIGTIEPVTTEFISFNSASVFDALTQIAEAFDAEWYITGTTINLVNKFQFGSEVDFENEVSVLSMSQSDGDAVSGFTRIVALGSTRNISPNYRETEGGEAVDAIYQKRLRIPISKGSTIDAWEDMTPLEAAETTVVFDDIYPKRIGTMSGITTKEYTDTDTDTGVVTTWNAYRYKDTGLTFSKDYIQQGVELRIVFQSGNLNGLDFAVKFNPEGLSETDPAAQVFEIVRNTDFGAALPNETLKPVNGDTYILYGFNIQLVSDLYIPVAEQELYDKGLAWVENNLRDKSVYTCPTVIQHFYDNEMDLEIGQKVKLINSRFDGGFRSSRIMGFEKKLINKYDAVYTVGDNAAYTWRNDVDSNIQQLQYAGQVFQNSGGNSVYLIKQFDNTPPSDFNAYSAVASNARFLNRQTGGTVQGNTTFQKDIKVQGKAISDSFGNETFLPGTMGNGFRFWIENGLSFGQLDYLTITREMLISVLTVAEIKSVDGGMLLSSANMVCSEVKELPNGYKCYFDDDNGNIPNKFALDDQAMCRRFNGANVKYYWRLVSEIGSNYILLSKTDKDGSGIPEAKDNIIQFGNRTDIQRQFATYLVGYGDAGTYYYSNVDSYDLTGKAKTYFSKSGSRIEGDSIVFSSSGKTAKSEIDTAQSAADNAIIEVSQAKASIEVLNNQIQSKVEQTDFNSLQGRVSTTESNITQLSDSITSTVEKVDKKNAAYKSYTSASTDHPAIPYSNADIWITYDGRILQSANTRLSGSFIESDWKETVPSVNDIQVGNRNYLLKAVQTGGWHGNGGGFGQIDYFDEYLRIATASDSGIGVFRPLSGVLSSNLKDKDVMVSFDAKANASVGGEVFLNNGANGSKYFNLTTQWQRISFPASFDSDDANIVITNLVGAIWYYFKNFQIVIGNKDVDYTEAPEDVEFRITTAQDTADSKNRTFGSETQPSTPSGGFKVGDLWYKTNTVDGCYETYRWNGTTWIIINVNVSKSRIEQTDSRITSVVEQTGIDSLGNGETLYSKINQTASEIRLEVNNIQIGNRNIILNSNASVNNSGSYLAKTYTTTIDLIGGKKYTFVIKGKTQGHQRFGLWLNSGVDNVGFIENTGEEVRYIVFTASTPSSEYNKRNLNVYNFPSEGSATNPASIEWVALYEGDVKPPLDWFPAPEDIGAIAGSSLTLTDNKISLASTTIELKGNAIAGAIKAGELDVGKFRVAPDGKIYATDGEFSGKITSTSGSIAGFSISNGKIGSEYNQDGLGLISSLIKFSGDNVFAAIGENVLPISSGLSAVGRFENNKINQYGGGRNYGVVIRTTGAGENIALDLTGMISGLAYYTRRISSNTTLTNADVFISCNNAATITITLPPSPDMGKMLKIFRGNTGVVIINGKSIVSTGVPNGSLILNSGRWSCVLVYDGQYWCADVVDTVST